MDNNYPTEFQKKMLWQALTGVSILILSGLLVFLVWLISLTLGYLQPVLIPLAVAGIIAYLLDPVVAWLQKKGPTRFRSVLCVFGGFLLVLILFGSMIIPPLVQQASEVIEDRHELGNKAKERLEHLREVSWVAPVIDWALEVPPRPDGSVPLNSNFTDTNIGSKLAEKSDKIMNLITTVLTASTGKIIGYFGLLIGMIMIPIYLYYFLIESAAIKENWQRYVPLRSSRFKTEVVETLSEINGYTIAFFRGQVIVAFIDGLLVGMALAFFGLPYGLVIGLCMAILGVIPFIGNLICLIPACIIAFLHFSIPDHQFWLGDSPWVYVAAVLLIFLTVQQINSLVTAPKIVGNSVGLHPMTVIFSMLFWSLILGGFVGALLAVPLTAAVKVIFVRYIWERQVLPHPEIENLMEAYTGIEVQEKAQEKAEQKLEKKQNELEQESKKTATDTKEKNEPTS